MIEAETLESQTVAAPEGVRARRSRPKRRGTAAELPERRRGSHERPSQHPWTNGLLAAACVLLVVEGGLIALNWSGTEPASSDPVNGASTALAPAAPNTDLDRVVDPTTSIADPDIVDGSRIDYMYGGDPNYTPPNIPVRTFDVLGTWLRTADALPTLPPWAGPWVWNPDVRDVDGRYVMWFTAFTTSHRLPITNAEPRCLGWATATTPLGPFTASPTPAVCQYSLYGAIDPRTFVAPDGQEWLYWKSDGNAVLADPLPTTIWAQRLAKDGVTLEGSPVALMTNSQPWEGRVVESPQMVFAHGHYWLFFSGNVSGSANNGIGVAECKGPAGPCANTAVGPWLGASEQNESVGEESLFTQHGLTWLLFSPKGFGQTLAVARVGFGPQGPYIAAFSHLPSVS